MRPFSYGDRMKKYRNCIILILLLAVFAFCTYSAVTDRFVDTELAVSRFINPNAAKNPVFGFFSAIGEVYGMVAVVIVLLIIPFTRIRVGVATGITTLVGWGCGTVIKHIVERPRPLGNLLSVGGYSFPSGHAISSAALYISLMLLLIPLCSKRWQRILTAVVCIALPLMIGISRIYFNAHYLTDVVGGWSLGSFFGILGPMLYFKLKGKKENGKDAA